jgi:hypothetical protein
MSEKSETTVQANAETSAETFKLKKSSIGGREVTCNLYIWRCPLCDRVITSHYYNKLIAAAKLHVERAHGLRVEVVDG